MTRRRRRGNRDFDLANLIAGVILLLLFYYTKNLKDAFHIGAIVLVLGGVFVGLIVYLRRSNPRAVSAPPERPRPGKQTAGNAPIGKLDQEYERQFLRPVAADTEKPVEWSLELIRSLDWKRFEELCAGYFQAKGRKAKVTNLGVDGGIDVLLYGESNPEKILGVVQCKAWTQKPVGVKEVRELLGVMTDVGCPLGVYVATSGYTPGAKAFAEGKYIKLMDAGQLFTLIQELPSEARADLLAKATSGDYTTPSCPSCGTKLVLRTSRKGKIPGQNFWGCRNFPRCRYTMHRAKSA